MRIEQIKGKTASPLYMIKDENDHPNGIFKRPDNVVFVHKLFGFLFFNRFHKQPFEYDGLSKRAVLAYELDQLLQLNLVPFTERREITDIGKGVFVQYMQGYENALVQIRKKSKGIEQINYESMQKAILFDFLIDAQDRTSMNWILAENGCIKWIDNDRSFLNSKKKYWMAKVDLNEICPEAQGEISNNVKQIFMNVSLNDFTNLLNKHKLPQNTIDYAKIRFRCLKQYIEENANLEDIYYSDDKQFYKFKFPGMYGYLRKIFR